MTIPSGRAPPAEKTTESMELSPIQVPPAIAVPRGDDEGKVSETLPQAPLESVPQRSTFRTLTVMIALFVSNNLIYWTMPHHFVFPLQTPMRLRSV